MSKTNESNASALWFQSDWVIYKRLLTLDLKESYLLTLAYIVVRYSVYNVYHTNKCAVPIAQREIMKETNNTSKSQFSTIIARLKDMGEIEVIHGIGRTPDKYKVLDAELLPPNMRKK